MTPNNNPDDSQTDDRSFDSNVDPSHIDEEEYPDTDFDEAEMEREDYADTRFDEYDQGKEVLNADGDTIGVITEISGQTAYVDPEGGMTDKIMSKLGWSGGDDEDFRLRSSSVERITDDAVYLRRDL